MLETQPDDDSSSPDEAARSLLRGRVGYGCLVSTIVVNCSPDKVVSIPSGVNGCSLLMDALPMEVGEKLQDVQRNLLRSDADF